MCNNLTTAFLFGKEYEKSFFLPCGITISNVGIFKQSLPDGMFLPTKDSKLEDNVPKNRYTNMLACKYISFSKLLLFSQLNLKRIYDKTNLFSVSDDHSRVKLRDLPIGHTDYINANYIDVSKTLIFLISKFRIQNQLLFMSV